MRKLFSLIVLLGISMCFAAQAQTNLYFLNRSKHKIIEVKVGHQLSIKYKGYLGQNEFAKQTVTEINDSMITLGVDPSTLGFAGKMLENNPKFIYRKIYIKDITSFRRMTVARQLLKAGLLVANIAGTYVLLTNLYNANNYSVFETFLISFGVGVGTSVIINSCFPENPKYLLENGWEVTTGLEKPKL